MHNLNYKFIKVHCTSCQKDTLPSLFLINWDVLEHAHKAHLNEKIIKSIKKGAMK
jgi:hypothetical protein